MRLHRARFRWLRWAGLSACTVVFGLWFLTAWCQYWLGIRHSAGRDYLVLTNGGVLILSARNDTYIFRPGLTLIANRWPFWDDGWHWTPTRDPEPKVNRTPLQARGFIPFWLPFVTIAAPTALLWWRPIWRRRGARGHCPACGYDLAGLPACPECGRANS